MALAMSLSSGDVLAADVANGQEIAQRWCSSCHLVGTTGTTSDAIPTFVAISRDPALMAQSPQTWFAKPHPAMPSLALTPREEEDIVAYIRALRLN
jgi:mono/diheme cytochrome c family protein